MKTCLTCGASLIGRRLKFCSMKCCRRNDYVTNGVAIRSARKMFYYDKSEAYKAQRNSPRGKYSRQRLRAIERGIQWLFTFETWVSWWGDAYVKRGRRSGQLIMGRYGDVGPYSPFNCYKTTPAENVKDNYRGGK